VSDGVQCLGLLTDIGIPTPFVAQALSGCDALVIECNHDPTLLANGDYPPTLKRRIAGRQGHLDNDAAADVLRAMDCSRLQHLIAAHLSKQNNRPDLARAALAAVVNASPDWIGIAEQTEGFGWRQIN
jgi:phosphoribosyl 1,2-cyclic phosphodiesterase